MDEKDAAEIGASIKSQLNSEAYKKAVEEQLQRMEAEYKVKEEADWFGKTGLDEETERELPHYLRRELGESLFDEGSLKANDLVYIGVYELIDGSKEHYWRIPWKNEEVYARIVIGIDGSNLMDWGNRKPPNEKP